MMSEETVWGQNMQLVPLQGQGIHNEVRIVLLGKTGVGKSATGNTILNAECFESKKSPASVTSKCSEGYTQRFGRTIQVVDTPGLLDTKLSEKALKEELSRCIGLSSPGPHCFLLVMESTRFTSEDENCINQFADMFGNNFFHYAIIVFTGKDDLDRVKKTIRNYLEEAGENLQNLIEKCNDRYIAFNNIDRNSSGEKQVEDLLEMIKDVVSQNNGRFYTNKLYEQAEKHIQKMEKEIIEVRNTEKKDETEKMEKELSKKNLSPEEKKRERKEKLKQIEDKYAKLPDPRHEVRNDLSGDGGFFLGVLIGVLGTLTMMGFLVLKLASMFKPS
ncbi:GTPase IMAP family member 9-like [Crassostrea angulata]|uniref:GTPase IMAP family member 9-like n=1 Tax=Magallana angulata TaxID=2784310 RepID=UPI0022B1BB3E|nr:GTPase IMAP family member 9-like [Crassostrea angulata]